MSATKPHLMSTVALVQNLRHLADDLERAARQEAPTAAELAAAPVLSGWVPQPADGYCLAGHVTGHPRLGNRLICTSRVFLLGEDRTWPRTLSRWYRLRDAMVEIPPHQRTLS